MDSIDIFIEPITSDIDILVAPISTDIDVFVDEAAYALDVFITANPTNIDVIVEDSSPIIEVLVNQCATINNITGGSDFNYVHLQPIANTIWAVEHNAGKFPAITIVNTANEEMEADINHISSNLTLLTFSSSTAGKVYVN